MRKCMIIVIFMALIELLVGSAGAAIVDIGCNTNPTLSWSFDFDLQLLTVEEVIYKTDPEWPLRLWVGGLADSDSTFSVELTITNETGIEWIGYKLTQPPPPMVPSMYIIPGNMETTKLQTITDTQSGWFFSEPPAVFDGESFIISFDMRAVPPAGWHGGFGGYVDQVPVYVPEPATMAFLGLGGLTAIRRRSAFNKRHKPFKG